MTLRLHDTMTREDREIHPAPDGTLSLYCCGPTVYGPAHIGNFRTFVMQDVFRRTAETCGMRVRHVRNITDVDDKTIRQSQAEGKSLIDFTAYWSERFHADCMALNLLAPEQEPGAVGHIEQQVTLISRLVDKGHAYRAADGSVYFDVSSFPSYGRLSRLAERSITTGAAPAEGEAVASDEYQRDDAVDFALWKARKPEDGPNYWCSPWGEGRPGWHLECSAMCMCHLGETVDVHSGGIDLIFPHHENEIAQSEAASGAEFVKHWFHIAHLMVDGSKMSKSLGNLYTLGDIRAKGFTPAEARYTLASGHYGQPLNFTWDTLHASRQAMARLRKAARTCDVLDPSITAPLVRDGLGVFEPAHAALCNDLNTPAALGGLFTGLRELEKKGEAASAEDRNGLRVMLYALGIDLSEDKTTPDEAPPEALALAEARWKAKAAKDWPEADRCRKELAALGWQVKDGKDGYELIPVAS